MWCTQSQMAELFGKEGFVLDSERLKRAAQTFAYFLRFPISSHLVSKWPFLKLKAL